MREVAEAPEDQRAERAAEPDEAEAAERKAKLDAVTKIYETMPAEEAAARIEVRESPRGPAAHAEGLLPWLERYTFPQEARFADPAHAAEVARFFFDELLRALHTLKGGARMAGIRAMGDLSHEAETLLARFADLSELATRLADSGNAQLDAELAALSAKVDAELADSRARHSGRA